MAENYTGYETFYQGGPSSLSPEYGNNYVGYRMSAAQLGFNGSPQTANQIEQTVNALKQGVKAFEVAMLMPDVAEAIPKQHFEEMRALMKLSGVKPSMHGPMIDAAGWGEKGWNGELGRVDNERRMFDAVEKAHMLDPNGNVPIVFHGSVGMPGPEFKPGKGKKRFVMEKALAINQDTKQVTPIETEYKFRPEYPELLKKKGKIFTPEGQLRVINESDWENKLTELATFSKHADEIIGGSAVSLKDYGKAFIDPGTKRIFECDKEGRITKELPKLNGEQDKDYRQIQKADIFLENIGLNFAGTFHKAYKYGSPLQKEKLQELAEDYKRKTDALRNSRGIPVLNPLKKQKIFEEAIARLEGITRRRYLKKNGDYVFKNGRAILDKRFGAPKVFKETESFSMDKAARTFGNLAMKSYEEFGKNAPVIALENFQPGTPFSTAKKLKKLVDDSRKNFVKRLIREEGVSKSEARSIAEKHLGVTWDVGHLNLIRKKGFNEKDILAETKKITKDKTMVKHIHLTDNFGFFDSHLAPGMGNVPFKKIMKQLEKTGRLDEMNKIVEGAGFVQHFKKSPHSMTMAAFGSPIYGMENAPYWNQISGVQGSYFGGYGTTNPQQHHSIYGSGFTTMPIELGGQMQGGQSRFGGTPMA